MQHSLGCAQTVRSYRVPGVLPAERPVDLRRCRDDRKLFAAKRRAEQRQEAGMRHVRCQRQVANSKGRLGGPVVAGSEVVVALRGLDRLRWASGET